uniref:Secreted protein n=1 Tax=Mesocestoides corti TaxID=53468 RepID=A0A5K3G0A5_MESCO
GTTEQALLNQSQTRTTSQGLPFESTTLATPLIIYCSSVVLLWLAAYLPRMSLERRGTQNYLRPGGLVCLRPDPTPHCLPLSNPSPNKKKTSTTEQALLTDQKPEPRVRRLPSEPTTLATPLVIYCISSISFSGWLPSFPVCHWIAERHGIG